MTISITRRTVIAGLGALVAAPSFGSNRPAAGVGARRRFDRLLLGAAWHPEQWPESAWGRDLDLMAGARLNVVRIGDPDRDVSRHNDDMFDLELIARAIRAAEERNLKVVMRGPANAPPAWKKIEHRMRDHNNVQGARLDALRKGETRALAFSAVGRGADGVLFRQWRNAPNGPEQYLGSVVATDGDPLPIYSELQQIGEEFQRVSGALRGTMPVTTNDSRPVGPGIEVLHRRGEGRDVFVLVNHQREPRRASFPRPMLDFLTGEEIHNTIAIAPYGVSILEKSK